MWYEIPIILLWAHFYFALLLPYARCTHLGRIQTERPYDITSRSGTSFFSYPRGRKNNNSPEPTDSGTTSGAYSVRTSSQCQKDKKNNKNSKAPWHCTVLKYHGAITAHRCYSFSLQSLLCCFFFTEEHERSQYRLAGAPLYIRVCASNKEMETEHHCHNYHDRPPSSRAEALSRGSSCALQDLRGPRLSQA